MASSFVQTENKTRSLELNPASAVGSMSPQVVALISASVLIFLVCLSSSIVLILRRRLRHRTQDTAQVEAQVQLPEPVTSQSEEKLENVSPSPSRSSKVPLLPISTAPLSGATTIAENPVEKLVSKASAALSKVDRYTTLPLRRARQARQARNAQKNPIFDFSTPLAILDAEIVNSENSGPSRHVSEQFSIRSTSLTSGPSTSSPAPRHLGLLPHSTVPPSNSRQSTLRPSPTVVSMEIRPLEVDAAALPDTGTMLVSGSFPSLSSCSSVISLSSVCHSTDDGHMPSEAEDSKYSYAILDFETPRRKENHHPGAEKGTPCSSTASLSTMFTRRDSSFSSDADTVCEVALGKTSLTVKPLKFDDPLSFPISVSDLCSDKGDDIFGSLSISGFDDLTNLTK